MILSTHAVLGAAVARLFPHNPVLGFFLGFISHFVFDAIPHWDYSLRSEVLGDKKEIVDMRWGKDFLFDIFRLGLDFAAGVGIVFIFFPLHGGKDLASLLAGLMGGVLPDALQFFYFKIKKEPLSSLQRFHKFIQSKLTLKHQPRLGIPLQGIIGVAAIVLSLILRG